MYVRNDAITLFLLPSPLARFWFGVASYLNLFYWGLFVQLSNRTLECSLASVNATAVICPPLLIKNICLVLPFQLIYTCLKVIKAKV